ncbi:TonB-dependent receptor domain-containing protein, partial [Brevundimonas sp. DWP1b2]|uniref:TonB-dependent receptor domain-containing protein n=1 Tax=Brevundimonas sp. DWP1b2 TaxID=2804659 RepID=UPI003CF34988
FLQTQGKKVVETPDWTLSTRVDWDPTETCHVGLQAKYVGDRFATDVNDEVAPSYVVADLDVRYDLPNISIQGAYVQLNVTNLFDEDYLGNISQGNNGLAAVVSSDPRVPLRGGLARTYSLGSPRTVQMTVGLKF